MTVEPLIIHVLRQLRSTPAGLRRVEVAIAVEAQGEHLEKVLEGLVKKGIVTPKDGVYCYEPTPAHEDFFHKLVEVYQNVSRKPEPALILQGLLLLAAPGHFLRYKTLRKILENEGLATEGEVNSLLAEEVKRGSVERIRICFGDKFRIRTPFCMPLSSISLSPFIPGEYEDFKKEWEKAGFLVQEEDYLSGRYPSEVAERAKQYLEKEGVKVKDKVVDGISGDVYDNWYKSRWFFQMTRIPRDANSKLPFVLAVPLPAEVW